MQTGFDDDGAETTLQYEEQYVEGEYDYYEDADYDYENDPNGENGYYGYTSDPGYYGQYSEYQEEEYWENGEEYYDQEYDEYNEEGDYDYYQNQREYEYSDYSGYDEVEEPVTVPTPGSFVAQRQMVLQGELPAMPALPTPKKTFKGLSHENKYNNSKLFPMQSSERLSYQSPMNFKGKSALSSISPKVTQIRA
ncbi:hypothetical protein C1645_768462 [Glomus cerebriforme]|uniref:Uncharacterized protein n=1 Tax=Glomus cerebriforme TaxID=658196 RepID=A0A397SYE2_9GLOM|nr:hypothetical protein C1645_768462 [Glomus cerebriforme]